ncbi:hypothetical protein HYY27_09665, partial [bacterium]|nr:hypothetical protein [bacterium]
MPTDPVPAVESIDRSQWRPEEYDLLFHFVNFARVANSVVTEPGPLQGWFREALWRHYSYAPFNARVMENYFSLAFFYGYDAPWNVYHRSPAILERLRLALDYTFGLMGENGAIPEYAIADIDAPMLAPSSFGMEYMSAALEVAGPLLPDDLRGRLVAQARKAAVYVLTAEESWAHARSFTNQFLGAMAGGLRLARLTNDAELKGYAERAGEALLGEFMSPMGYLYENDGAETFAYFFVTLGRLVPLYHEWPDARWLEVLRRHCAWMARHMLLEPDGRTVILAGSHQTRTGSGYRLTPRGGQRGLGDLMADGHDERQFMKLFLSSAEAAAQARRAWEEAPDPVGAQRQASKSRGYVPVSTLWNYATYAPPEAEIAEALGRLPCLDPTTGTEKLEDDRGNQYIYVRHPNYYAGFCFATHRTTAAHGPSFLWHGRAGTLVLSENGDRPRWETQVGEGGTGRALALAKTRGERGGQVIEVRYPDLNVTKTYVLRPEGWDVFLSARAAGDRAL